MRVKVKASLKIKIEDVSWVICYNSKTQKFLLGERSQKVKKSLTWGFPGGHLDMFEGAKSAAAREFSEETDYPISKKDLQKIAMAKDYKGKRYNFYLYTIDEDFTPVSKDGETNKFDWFTIQEIPKLGNKLHKSSIMFRDHILEHPKFKDMINPKPNLNKNDVIKNPVLNEALARSIA